VSQFASRNESGLQFVKRLTDVPTGLEYTFVPSRKTIKSVEMKRKEFEAFYDDIIHQITLRTIYYLGMQNAHLA